MKCRYKRSRRWFACLTALLMSAVLICTLSTSVFAEGGLSMSTSYPGISAKAGDTLSFNLDFTNTGEGCETALTIASIPDGWNGYFEGNGVEISHVYVKNGTMEQAAAFDLEIPMDAAEGTYEVKLRAEGSGASSVLTLTLHVSEEQLGSSALTTQYAEQEGDSDTSFSFSSTLQNNTPNEQSYSLSAEAPSGWTVAFKADSTQVAAISAAARSSESLTIEVTPPANVDAGEYTIPISAISASETLTGELKVVITGTYDVSLSTPSGRLSFDAVANRKSTVTLQISNTGNVDLQNLNLSSSAPSNWTVEFSQSTIDTLEAGATVEITAYVTPAKDAMSGDYSATLTIKNDNSSDSEEFRITVKTETTWGVVGFVLIAAAVLGLGYIFRKFGRR